MLSRLSRRSWRDPNNFEAIEEPNKLLPKPSQQFGFTTDKHGYRELELALKLYF